METTTQPTSNKPTVKEKITFMINAAMYYKGISKDEAIELVFNYLNKAISQELQSGNAVKNAAEWCRLVKERSCLQYDL